MSEIGVESENCPATWPKFDDHCPRGTLAFQNGLEDHNFDLRKVIANHCCTCCRNLVRFGSVTPEFKS